MARRKREDEPGSILHIFNRGVGKRTVFENRSDVRYFLSRLAREHRRGRLLIHAFVLLANHFHLLVESPLGMASEAMRVVQNQHVRRFNRLRKRDGPLFRGRFGSRRVMSDQYWWTLLRYIDLHPVRVRLSTSEGVYPFGSAYHYLRRAGPRWLTRDRVEGLLMDGTGLGSYDPALYERILARPLSAAEQELVELRMSGAGDDSDPLDDLVSAGRSQVRDWMVDKASKADGTRPGLTVLAPTALSEEVTRRRRGAPDWSVTPRRRKQSGWDLILAGLLRDLCGLSFRDVAVRAGITAACAETRLRTHRELLTEDAEYSERVADVVSACAGSLRPRAL